MSDSGGPGLLGLWGVLSVVASFRLSRINKIVPDPYLDEVFHIRQAQVYCNGHFQVWDPKITTPPGLYFISVALSKVIGDCSTIWLRSVNVLGLCLVGHLSYLILRKVHQQTSRSLTSNTTLIHRAINIAFFPPLFFFSGLYYTDVFSTVFVLLAFLFYLNAGNSGYSIGFMTSAIASLSFRQTNIFWVAILPAGLTLFSVCRKSISRVRDVKTGANKAQYQVYPGFNQVFGMSWKYNLLYDPPIEATSIISVVKSVMSLIIMAPEELITIVKQLLPFGSLVGLFGAFVYWNGGVVLGDKSNHVATIHVPQMLYLWPYILFFSWPLALPAMLSWYRATNVSSKLQTTVTLMGLTIPALAAVHYNTIVHPFTLADNRHYVFYVFRVLMRHPAIKYLATPAYVVSGFAAIQTLARYARSSTGSAVETATAVSPKDKAKISTTANGSSPATQPNSQTSGAPLSFLLTWLGTTTLTLITAPLVEPRYCILPWIFWRLYIPLSSSSASSSTTMQVPRRGLINSAIEALSQETTQLWLETFWLLSVNVITGYTFLFRGFEWPQEPGLVQRFMW